MARGRRFLRLAGILAGLAGAAAGVLVAVAAWAYRQAPMPALDAGRTELAVSERRSYALRTGSGEARTCEDLTLEGAPAGPLQITLSRPEGVAGPLPVLVILGGLEIGRDSLNHVEVHGRNALVTLQYPRSPSYWYEGPPLARLPEIRAAVLAVPARVAAVLEWAGRQPWADRGRISLLGYSFGAIFVPASARLAQQRGLPLRALVLAYGGADVPALLAANARLRPAFLRRPAAWLAGAWLAPIEPALHLPHLRQRALFLNGRQDTMVPLAAARRMQDLHGGPKTILELDAPHMDPGRPDLTREIVRRSQAWLAAHGAADL